MFDSAIGDGTSQGAIDDRFAVRSLEVGLVPATGRGKLVFSTRQAGRPPTSNTLTAGAPLQPGEYVCIDTDELDAVPARRALACGVRSRRCQPTCRRTRHSHLVHWPGGPWYDRQPPVSGIEAGPRPAGCTAGLVAGPWYPGSRRHDRLCRTVFVTPSSFDMVAVQISSSPRAPTSGSSALEPAHRGPPSSRVGWRARGGPALDADPVADAGVRPPAVEKPLLAPAGRRRGLRHAAPARRHVLLAVGSIDNHAKSTGRLDIERRPGTNRSTTSSSDLPEDGVDGRPPRPRFARTSATSARQRRGRLPVGYDDVPRVASEAAGPPAAARVRRHQAPARPLPRDRDDPVPRILPARDRRGLTRTANASSCTAVPRSELIVPSSRRPEPPDVLYMVPTFTWEEETLSGLLSQQFLATTTAGVRRRARGGRYRHRRSGDSLPADVPPDAAGRRPAGLPPARLVLVGRRRTAGRRAEGPAVAHVADRHFRGHGGRVPSRG